MTRSRTWVASMPALNPRQSAISWLAGFLRTSVPRQISTGTSDVEIRNRSSSSCTSASRSRSRYQVRVPVAREELLDPQRPGRVVRADQDHVAQASCDQLHAAQDEGAHQDLAQLGVALDETRQSIARQLDQLAAFPHPRLDQGPAARDHVHLAGELARAVDGDQRLAAHGGPDDLDAAADHDEEGHRFVPGVDQHLARLRHPAAAVGGNPRDLRGRQRGEDPVRAGGRRLQRRLSVAHGHRRASRTTTSASVRA